MCGGVSAGHHSQVLESVTECCLECYEITLTRPPCHQGAPPRSPSRRTWGEGRHVREAGGGEGGGGGEDDRDTRGAGARVDK
jgi:hypothetical protein